MELDNRKVIILITIIKNYLETGEPVGSRTISKYSGLNLSSATIRNEMSDLEEMGYILQPHTSAGRIPSDKGYRFYVDSLIQSQQAEIHSMRQEMSHKVDHLEQVLQKLVRSLAVDTNYAAMITGPSIHKNKIKFIQISLVDAKRILVVIMMEGNIVRTTMINIAEGEEPGYNAVLNMNLILNNEISGLSSGDITEGRCAQVIARCSCKKTMKAILKAIYDTISLESGQTQIYTSGATNIFKYPELSESGNATKLISAFEQKDELVELVHDVTDQADETRKPIQVYIGSESPLQNMDNCSVITASYQLGDGLRGTVGVIGPKRMDYEKVLATLNHLMSELDDNL